METIIAACGLVCSACEAYLGTKNYDYARICRTADDWSRQYGVHVAPERVWCSGCMTEGGPKCAHCDQRCEIRACVREKQYSTCAECSEYPCSRVRFIVDGVPFTKHILEALKGVKPKADSQN